jgi:hypothetical protein
MDILCRFVNISHNISAFVSVQLFFENFDISVLKCSAPFTTFSVIGLFFPPGPFEFFKQNRTCSTKTIDLLLHCRPLENFCCRFFLCDSIYYDCILASKGWLISPHTVTRLYTLLAP